MNGMKDYELRVTTRQAEAVASLLRSSEVESTGQGQDWDLMITGSSTAQ